MLYYKNDSTYAYYILMYIINDGDTFSTDTYMLVNYLIKMRI